MSLFSRETRAQVEDAERRGRRELARVAGDLGFEPVLRSEPVPPFACQTCGCYVATYHFVTHRGVCEPT